MAQQYHNWNVNEGSINTNVNPDHDEERSRGHPQFDIVPRPLQYRESSLNPYDRTPNAMTSSMQSLHSEVSQQYQDISNPSRSYEIGHSGQRPHRMASAEQLQSSIDQPSGRLAPYANSWHHGQSGYEEVHEPPRAARRAASFQTEEPVGYATTAPAYSGRHSRRSSIARSIGQTQGRTSSELGDVYATAIPSPNLHGPIPMPRTSNTSLHYAYNPQDDGITRQPSSLDTTAVSRRSGQSYRNGATSIRSPTGPHMEHIAYEVDGRPISSHTATHGYPFPHAPETIITVKEGPTDERSIATSGDDGDMIVRQDLRRQLHERHVGMIALTGAIGIGLFLTSGRVLKIAGPGGAVLAYFLMGTVANAVMACLGEMTALISIPGPMSEFASRFVDDSLGFAVGWMFW
ncbi:hypothetical protein ABW21_db0206651 [Orbilia brochopaga]|nr:hypothetical protein ABW21_db0206651 [Drechslerella brochopaga]